MRGEVNMAASFRPCSVITLTTDFGHKGPYVASMKGVMLTRHAAVRIIDMTHETEVHWPAEAGFWLSRSYRYFPAGTVHLAVVDPGVGTGRDIIVATCHGHAFVAPDNGLLGTLLTTDPGVEVFKLDLGRLEKLGIAAPSVTFHGRDIFAPLGADLASGKRRLGDVGPRVNPTDLVPSWLDEPEVVGNQVRGRVVTFDHFGNIITNIDAALVERFESAIVRVGGRDFPMRRTYGDLSPGEYLALINSFDVVEIARAESSAHQGLGAERGAPVVVREGG
jgi:hypothetical protein